MANSCMDGRERDMKTAKYIFACHSNWINKTLLLQERCFFYCLLFGRVLYQRFVSRISHRLRERVHPDSDGSLLKVPEKEVTVKPSAGQQGGGLRVETEEVGLLMVS